jgi:2-dehydro-3-deoxygluconokinase
MPVFVGGAELNAATALAKWNLPVTYCSAAPDNFLSREVIASIEERGIQTDRMIFSGDRIGTYYLPQGADMKAAGVIYDRAYSSFAELEPGQMDWDEKLEGISWFHFSAINPAVSKKAAAVCKEVVEVAAKKNITVSVDLNYRAKLWQWGKPPVDVMPELAGYANLIMGNIWAEEKMLGVPVPEDLADNKEAYLDASLKASERILKQFPNCSQVANTFRFDADKGVRYYATYYNKQQLYTSREHNRLQPQEIIDFAAAAAFNKLFIKGDATTASAEEIKKGYLNHA